MDHARETFWQSRWASAGLARGERDPGKAKFYALVAYPGSSGFLHLGHLRGFALADALHRYHRMRGKAVFFPTGTHASGLPAVTFAQRVKDRDRTVVRQLEEQGVPVDEWSRLEDPIYAARFLGKSYLAVHRALGILVDESAYLTTIDDDYQAFIRWQFGRLDQAGALRQEAHYSAFCPVCGPVSVDPSETDLSSGGTAERIQYTLVPFRLSDGRLLPAATLRPETVYGVTNLWLPTEGSLVTWHHGEDRFLVTPTGGQRLVDQNGGHLGAEVAIRSLIGNRAEAPITRTKVPILASTLVDPEVGTGVVMSVPAHAPADWLALAALGEMDRSALGPPPIIIEVDQQLLSENERDLLDGDGLPAERAARTTRARSLSHVDQLKEATERLYRLEATRGRMRSDVLDGASVADARQTVGARLASEGHSPILWEFSEPVICRNGHEVVIRKVPDQWFLHYGDPVWKSKTRTALERLSVVPEEYGRELPSILDWLSDRPCTRRGRWLGTPFPKDESWVIEPIADSTLYMAYFPIHRFVASGELEPGDLTGALFDFVLLGEGEGEPSVPLELQRKVRAEFEYWYPLDANIGGKEHKKVHFPVFLSTHALLLAPRWQPRSVIAHGWLTGPGGGKISKKEVTSKGGAIPPVRDALDRWGADALRLYLLQSASASQDFEWDPARVEAVQGRLEEVERLVRNALEAGSGGPPELDRWLESRVHEILTRFEEAFSRADLRGVAEAVYAELPSVVRRYLVRGGSSGAALQKAAVAWIRLMSPITPHLAEELFQGRGDRLVAAGPLPDPTEFARAPGAVVAEALVDRVEDDLRSVLRPAQARGNAPDEVIFYIAAPWKTTVERWLRKPSMTPGQVPSLRSIMERAASVPELSAYRDRIPKYVQRIAPGLLSEPPMPEETVDELGLLRSLEGYLVRRFGFRSVAVFEEDSAADHDPAGRRERARPGRPAFYLYGGATHSAGPGGSSPSAGGGRSRAEPPSPPSASGGSARPPGGEKR